MSILSTILAVESGGRNVTQGNIGDINNARGTPAQGYFQITDPTWAQFGGLSTGYSSAIDAPYATQLQVAQNIPIGRWGPATQSALAAAGYTFSPSSTLGQVMGQYGESGSGSLPGAAGSVVTPTAKSLPQFAQLFGGNTSTTATANPNANFDAAGGAPVTVTNAAVTGQIAGQAVQSGLKQAGSDVKTTGAAIDATATTLTQSTFNAVSDFFIRGGLGLLALILVGLALWQFGRQQLVSA